MEKRHMTLATRVGRMFLVALISTSLVGCASIIKGGDQSVTIKSNPADAKLIVYDERQGSQIINAMTPHTASLKRGAGYFKKAKYRVVIEKAGYQKQEFMLEGSPNGWYLLGNLIFGGLIGYLIVDPITGAMWSLEDVDLTLTARQASRPQEEGLQVVLTTALPELPESIRSKMKPVRVQAHLQ